jgi:hypothetical protein
MSASDFPSTPIGLPASFKNELPMSISDECKSYTLNVFPETNDTIVGPGLTAPVFVSSNTGGPWPFTRQRVVFNIPNGGSDSVFLDPVATTLTFRMSYRVITASAGGAGPVAMSLIGSGASWFERLELYSSIGQLIERIDEYGLLQNFLLQNTVSMSERWGGIGVSMGADSNSANGIDLPHQVGGTTYFFSFTIPLMSVIGVNSDKHFPIGMTKGIQLVMYTADTIPIANYCTTIVTTQPVFSGITLDSFSLNLRYVDVGREAAQQLRQTLQAGKWLLKSTTYLTSISQIPNGTFGQFQTELGIRGSSIRSILHQFSIQTSAQCLNGVYDAINPALNRRQLQIGAAKYPSREISDLNRPSEAYTYLIHALGGGIAKSLGTSVLREAYNAVFPSVPAGSDAACVAPASGLRAMPINGDGGSLNYQQIIKFPNAAYYGYDLERVNSVLFSGVNTKQQPPVLNLNFAAVMTRIITCYAWGMADCILEFDSATKEVKAFV